MTNSSDEQQSGGRINLFYGAAFSGFCLSQLSSYLVERYLTQGNSVQILPFLNFTHVRNMGGVFGMFQGKGWVFALVASIFIVGVAWFVIRGKRLPSYEYFGLGCIVGGGLANIADRLIYGSVIDFVDVQGLPFWHYIFNTADMLIHLGIWSLVLYGLLGPRPEQAKATAVVEGETPS